MFLVLERKPMNGDPVKLVLERLPGAKKLRAGQWIARCPAHDDSSPSLSIGTGDDGRALLTCHAGCTLIAICESLGITVADLHASKPAPRRKSVVAEYDYADENGEVLYVVVRYLPKQFTQYRPHADGRRILGLSADWYAPSGKVWKKLPA